MFLVSESYYPLHWTKEESGKLQIALQDLNEYSIEPWKENLESSEHRSNITLIRWYLAQYAAAELWQEIYPQDLLNELILLTNSASNYEEFLLVLQAFLKLGIDPL